MILLLQTQCFGTSTPKQAETRSESTEEMKKTSKNIYHTRCSEPRKGKNERSRYRSREVQKTARISDRCHSKLCYNFAVMLAYKVPPTDCMSLG